MKKVFQLLAVLLAIGALSQTLTGAVAHTEASKGGKGGGEPGV